jgi:hypothetical protein
VISIQGMSPCHFTKPAKDYLTLQDPVAKQCPIHENNPENNVP